jgi:hypothetical protein
LALYINIHHFNLQSPCLSDSQFSIVWLLSPSLISTCPGLRRIFSTSEWAQRGPYSGINFLNKPPNCKDFVNGAQTKLCYGGGFSDRKHGGVVYDGCSSIRTGRNGLQPVLNSTMIANTSLQMDRGILVSVFVHR